MQPDEWFAKVDARQETAVRRRVQVLEVPPEDEDVGVCPAGHAMVDGNVWVRRSGGSAASSVEGWRGMPARGRGGGPDSRGHRCAFQEARTGAGRGYPSPAPLPAPRAREWQRRYRARSISNMTTAVWKTTRRPSSQTRGRPSFWLPCSCRWTRSLTVPQ
jgi:hypothetical protein